MTPKGYPKNWDHHRRRLPCTRRRADGNGTGQKALEPTARLPVAAPGPGLGGGPTMKRAAP